MIKIFFVVEIDVGKIKFLFENDKKNVSHKKCLSKKFQSSFFPQQFFDQKTNLLEKLISQKLIYQKNVMLWLLFEC